MAANLSSSYSDESDNSLSDINVTPLVDVVLVLLIVFMITVPAIVGAARVKVDLPETSAVAADPEVLPYNFVLKQGASGEPVLYLNDDEIDEAGVRKLFQDRGTPSADQPVSLSADKRLPYGRVIKVVDLLESCGIEKLSLDTRHFEAR
jgi:biopolymer transport protein ExbD